MSLYRLPTVDTRSFFRPAARALIDDVLSSLSPDAWTRQTVAGSWTVRDVVAHLTDTALRRLSFQRDRHVPPAPPRRGVDVDLLSLVNQLNQQWITTSHRLSNRVVGDLYDAASGQLADLFESMPLDAAPLFPVSWAGDDGHLGWLDIGREFTEVWHHHAQIREAVGAGLSPEPAWLRAVIDVALHAWPPVYRDVRAPAGTAVLLQVSGEAGGTWTLLRSDGRWTLWAGRPDVPPSAIVELSDDSAWRLLFNALRPADLVSRVVISGDAALAEPFLRTRALVV